MLRVESIAKGYKDILAVKDLYKSSFPKEEQAPMFFLLQRAKKGYIEFNAYYDNETLVGITYLISYRHIRYVLYIATAATERSKGYGSQILDHIKAAYPDDRIILNIEIEDESANNNEQRKKRKLFYIKNGFSSSGIFSKLFGVTWELMVYNGTCSAKEFLMLHKKSIGSVIYFLTRPFIITKGRINI